MDQFDQPVVKRKSMKSSDAFPCVGAAQEGVYPFHLESNPLIRWSALRNNPLSGITFPRLVRLLCQKHRQRSSRSKDREDESSQGGIDWIRYMHRIVALLLLSLFNSVLELWEMTFIAVFLRAEMALSRQDSQAPVFVLGHPRTGTTMLHSLLALDKDRFNFCNTFAAGFPTAFLSFEWIGKRLFASVLTKTRPMDNMPLHFDLPQEDELATCLLTGGRCSPYMSLYFPRDERQYRKYQTLSPRQRVSHHDRQKWTNAFLHLLTKLKCRDIVLQQKDQNCPLGKSKPPGARVLNYLKGLMKIVHKVFFNPLSRQKTTESLPKPRRLVLKSPCHTGRVEYLLQLFPDAQFIFLHRNPYEVFLSGAHMASTTYGYCFLQQPTEEEMQEYILRQGEILIGEYNRCKQEGLLQLNKNLVEVSFEQLTTTPYETVKRIYKTFGWATDNSTGATDKEDRLGSNFNLSSYGCRLQQECKSLKSYKRNRFEGIRLDDALRQEIDTRWSLHFGAFGYDTQWPLNAPTVA